uniref:2-oxoglutarate-dependent dioxygenase DAO n=1 Tax=Brassica campestris TaxID=3711 RepID=M4DJN0_BRACM
MGPKGWFILKLLMFQGLFISHSQEQEDFDFFYLVLQWPGAYCDTKRSCCYPTSGKPAADFGIHGLWPNYKDGTYPSNCNPDSEFDKSQITDLVSSLKKTWPTLACPSNEGFKFWKHEWEKHGTCSESVMDQHEYFENSLKLRDRANLLQALTNSGIKPDDRFYDLEKIRKAIKDEIGFTPGIECNKDPEQNYKFSAWKTLFVILREWKTLRKYIDVILLSSLYICVSRKVCADPKLLQLRFCCLPLPFTFLTPSAPSPSLSREIHVTQKRFVSNSPLKIMAKTNGIIPTIDLGEVSDKILNQQIREASERWGCFRVINHGVPLSLMSDMKMTVMDLFERPHEVKVRNTDVLLGSGYRAPNEINPYYEALGLYDMASPQAVNTFCDQLEASADQREIMVKYAKAIDGLAKDLARRLAESYGLAETNFFKGWPSQFRINKYHFQPEAVGKLGVQLHTDSGFLTILQDDENVDGLEAMDHSSGTFFPISPLPNTLAINLGDMAAIWSNGRLCNVKHRVQCNEATKRFSIASFLLGPMDTDLEPPSEFVDAEHPRLYKAISHDGVRNIRMTTKLHDGEALKLITYEE